MSKIGELVYDIQELYIDGHSARSIATILDIPVEMVLGALDSFGVDDFVAEDTQEFDF